MKKKRITPLILLIICLSGTNLNAQFYQTGQAPASIKWKQINTANFRLIFPESFESQSLRMAGLLEESWQLTGHTLNHQPSKIPVVIHNHNARSNGLVSWAPKRMELYPTPPQQTGGMDWLTQLALHEQRHVVQIDKLNQGITSILGIFMGEQSTGFAAGRLPLWFLEGDAVTTETLLTRTGRGRMASFDMPLRALLLSDQGIYNYDKFLFGSYRDHVPDQYQYGYQMVTALRRDHGSGLWENTLNFTGRWVVHPAPFARSLKRETGENLTGLHKTVLNDLRGEWESQTREDTAAGGYILNIRGKEPYHSYRFPQWEGDSAIVVLKTGIAQPDEFIRVDMEGGQKSLHFPGQLSSPSFSISGRRIAWTEFRPDLRWDLRQYSVIKVFDMDSGAEWSLGSRSRHFAPAFAPDGLFLAAVEVDIENREYIFLINSVTGEVAERFPAPEGQSLQRPVFHPGGGEIFVTSVGGEGTAIMSLQTGTGEWKEILKPSYVNISGVFPCGDMVCFSSDMQGIDDIFATDLRNGSLWKITGSRFGALDGSLSPKGNNLVWSDYTASGFDLAIAQFDNPADKTYGESSCSREVLIETLVSEEKGIAGKGIYDSIQWQPEPYRKGMNLFRFHSWAPFYYDYGEFNIAEQPVYPGVTLLSQNLLNTAYTILGYSWKAGRHIAHGSFIWKGWYPVVEAGFDYGDQPMVFSGRDTIGPSGNTDYGLLNLKGLISLPLNLSGGRWIAGLEPRLRINYNNSLYHYGDENTYKRGMTTIETGLVAYRYRRGSRRDILPAWGQVFRWQRRNAPFESENLGAINAFELTLYLPGLFPHHSFRLDAALQRQDPVKYYYNSLVSFPRGYTREIGERLQILKSSYSFPLLYPDLAVPGVLYLKRIHAQLFTDFGVNRLMVVNTQTNRREWQDEDLLSLGSTLTANFHLFRIVFPFNFTGGFAYIPDRNETSFLFSFGANLNI